MRVTVTGLPGVAAVQFAANGSPARAAARAMTVLPASVPAPTTDVGAEARGQVVEDPGDGVGRERVERRMPGDVDLRGAPLAELRRRGPRRR